MKHGVSKPDYWFPLYVDKWIFGSTRHELIVEEGDLRGIWIDLLALSKKDGGYIRANEETPYPHSQLAGMFNVRLEHLNKCIELCLINGKLTEPSVGIYFVSSTDEFELSERHKRRVSAKMDMMSSTADMGGHREEKRREEKRRESPTDSSRALEPDKPKQLFDLWNASVTPPIPRAKDLNPGRRKKFNQYLKIRGWEEAFREGVARVVKSDFCRKKVPTNKCPNGWVITLDFLLANDTNSFRAAEGQYDHKATPQRIEPKIKSAEEYFAETEKDTSPS